jgi:Tfp pilus assembly PilM family ATPase
MTAMGLNLLNHQKIELAGLDIGSSTVKLVRLSKSQDGYALIAADCETIAPSPDDKEQERRNRVDAIKTCLQKADFHFRRCPSRPLNRPFRWRPGRSARWI